MYPPNMFEIYNTERPLSSLDDKTPGEAAIRNPLIALGE
jgi:hypothetical protein